MRTTSWRIAIAEKMNSRSPTSTTPKGRDRWMTFITSTTTMAPTSGAMRLSAKKFLRKHHEARWALLWNPTRSSPYYHCGAGLHASDETTHIAHEMVFRLEQQRIEQWKNQLKRTMP